MHHVVPRLQGTPGTIRDPAPALGQHNRELLAPLGIDAKDYDRMLASGVAYEEGSAAKAADDSE
jgi:formyl-CoA transferase